MAFPGSDPNFGKLLEAFLEKANSQGTLTTADLIDGIIDVNADPDQLLQLVHALQLRGVEVVDSDSQPLSLENDFPLPLAGGILGLEYISSDDMVSLYLKEMSLVPLLKVEEEIHLAQRIEQANQARCEFDQLNGRNSRRRRQEIEAVLLDGELARDYLIRANTRLVVSIARRYIGRGVPFLDLIQEGNLGLMRAVEKYEYRRGFRFSTYATWWIRQSISRAVADQGRTIRVPVHMTDRLRQIYKASQDMEQELGRTPTTQELASQLELDQTKVRWMLEIAQTPISLESPVGGDEDSELGMYVEDESTPGPAQAAYQNMLRERVEEVLASLTPREARILRLRFGLGQDRAYTLEEVGQKFGLTRERIRQIEGKALRRLRHPHLARLLREYA